MTIYFIIETIFFPSCIHCHPQLHVWAMRLAMQQQNNKAKQPNTSLNSALGVTLVLKLLNRPHQSLKFLFWIKLVLRLTWHAMWSCHVSGGQPLDDSAQQNCLFYPFNSPCLLEWLRIRLLQRGYSSSHLVSYVHASIALVFVEPQV